MRRILVVEDEIAVLENIVELLQDYNYEVIFTNHGKEATKLAKESSPDLIICDIMMPEVNGFEVLLKLQEDEKTRTIPFIFLTAKADKEDIRHGMDLGADDYLTKPFTPDQLFKAIDSRLKKRESQDELAERRLEELKKNIASTMPHEFRTPLNGILASSQFLLEYFDSLDKDEIKQLHESIHTSAQRLHRHIINYLFYADLEWINKEQAQKQNAGDCITHAPSELALAVFNKKAIKSNRMDDLILNIKSNPKIKIKQEHFLKICEEIADNAFKFSEPGHEVVLTIEGEDSFCKIISKDHGRGINTDHITRIGAYMQFERKVYEQQGSGLGLIIVKRLTEIYNGKFSIYSEMNKYTSVEIKIPIILD